MALRLSTFARAFILVTLTACEFSPSNTVQSGDAASDGDAQDPANSDGGACPSPVHLDFSVNEVSGSADNEVPVVHTLLGDRVRLSIGGSCSQGGDLQARWIFSSENADVAATAVPALDSATIEVYSKVAEEVRVTLEIQSGDTIVREEFVAFESHGFASIDAPTGRVNSLFASDEYMWIGSATAGFRVPLASLDAPPYDNLDDLIGGEDELGANLHIPLEQSPQRLWIGSRDVDDAIFAVDLAAFTFTTFDLENAGKTKAISLSSDGVRVGTDNGVFLSTNSQTFLLERIDKSEALGGGSQGNFSGGERLYPLPQGEPIDIFGVANNRIRTIADDGTKLWIASDGEGVATWTAPGPPTIYNQTNTALQSLKARALTIDAAGDVWVVTDKGVARYLLDRDLWLPMGNAQGLGGRLKLRAIAIDENSGRRSVFVGGDDGLALMALP